MCIVTGMSLEQAVKRLEEYQDRAKKTGNDRNIGHAEHLLSIARNMNRVKTWLVNEILALDEPDTCLIGCGSPYYAPGGDPDPMFENWVHTIEDGPLSLNAVMG